MKVRELIAGSTFTPGPSRDSAEPPRVTIILPTFRRGDSGLLGRTIDSLLGQSFADFELIIIDDASTDSSAQVIAAAMKRDPRISLIRHPRNIGLPAVSEYEAYVLARAPLISFAFDDTVFHRHGLRRLVRESERYPDMMIAGYVTAFFRTPFGEIFSQSLGTNVEEADLLSRNVIPNNAVLAPKTLLDRVGLYDPHISIARLCDYDLWLRVRRRFPIRFIETCIGQEFGPSTYDSLGHTYALDDWTTDDRMRQRRDHLLTPDRFPDIDVFDSSPFESARSRAIVADLARRHLATRDWMTAAAEPKAPAGRVPRILVVAAGIGASTQLYFEALRDVPDLHVRVIDPRIRPFSQLAEADALIVVRHLRHNMEWVRIARAIGVPVFFFLDDNLPLMAMRRELDRDQIAEFTRDHLLYDLRPVSGILTSADRLAESLREQALHRSVEVIRLAAPGVIGEWTGRGDRTETPIPTLVLFVGPHRLREVRRTLWPALVETSRLTGQKLRLLVPSSAIGGFKRLPDRDRVEIVPFPTSSDYFVALRTLNELGTDVVLVPRTRTVNAEFKSLHPLLTAAALGAALVAPAADPYLELSDVDGVTLVAPEGTTADWVAALSAVVPSIGQAAGDSRAVPPEVLTSRFDPAEGAAQLIAAVGAELPAAEPDEQSRLRQIADWTATQLVLSRSGHALGAAPPTESGTIALVAELQTTLRRSRQLHAFRGRSRRIPGFRYADLTDTKELAAHGEIVELSVPLTDVAYLSYPVRIEPGRYLKVHAMVWGDGVSGDLVGIEVVDPDGQIRLHSVTELPRDDKPVTVTFDARKLRVEHEGLHEVRIFAKTSQLAFVLERVDRGRLGLRRPRVSPLIRFER